MSEATARALLDDSDDEEAAPAPRPVAAVPGAAAAHSGAAAALLQQQQMNNLLALGAMNPSYAAQTQIQMQMRMAIAKKAEEDKRQAEQRRRAAAAKASAAAKRQQQQQQQQQLSSSNSAFSSHPAGASRGGPSPAKDSASIAQKDQDRTLLVACVQHVADKQQRPTIAKLIRKLTELRQQGKISSVRDMLLANVKRSIFTREQWKLVLQTYQQHKLKSAQRKAMAQQQRSEAAAASKEAAFASSPTETDLERMAEDKDVLLSASDVSEGDPIVGNSVDVLHSLVEEQGAPQTGPGAPRDVGVMAAPPTAADEWWSQQLLSRDAAMAVIGGGEEGEAARKLLSEAAQHFATDLLENLAGVAKQRRDDALLRLPGARLLLSRAPGSSSLALDLGVRRSEAEQELRECDAEASLVSTCLREMESRRGSRKRKAGEPPSVAETMQRDAALRGSGRLSLEALALHVWTDAKAKEHGLAVHAPRRKGRKTMAEEPQMLSVIDQRREAIRQRLHRHGEELRRAEEKAPSRADVGRLVEEKGVRENRGFGLVTVDDVLEAVRGTHKAAVVRLPAFRAAAERHEERLSTAT